MSFAFPEDILRPLVPEGLKIDSYEGLGFVTLAMVWTKSLRPAGFPTILGRDFFLAGYRIFTRLEDEAGRSLRGLKIIRSETDSRFMVFSGNLMTGYNYRHVSADIEEESSFTRVSSRRADGEVTFDLMFESDYGNKDLPEDSPFPDWRTARRFSGPMPFTFSPQADGTFVIVEGSRGSWKPQPVGVVKWHVGLFGEDPFRGVKPILANAFVVRDVDYRWEKGRIVTPGGRQ